MSDLNLILLGPPGSGTGTQGERLQEDLELPYYATGDILRAAVRNGTDIGREAKDYMERGDLVPDGVMVGVLAERIDQKEAEFVELALERLRLRLGARKPVEDEPVLGLLLVGSGRWRGSP